MRMGNPSVRRWVSKSQRGEIGMEIQPATYKGVYGKATLFALLTIVSAIATELIMLWAINSGKITEALITVGIATAVCFVPLLIMSFVIAFVPTSAKVLGFVYAVLQGGLLGLLALFVDMFYPGIAFAAFLGTAIVFLISLAVSAVCVIWATIMLTWDLQNIDYLVKSGADKKYEWSVAFSLVTTLVYLYVEILELLLRLVMIFGRNKN